MFIWYSQINKKCRQMYNGQGIAFVGKGYWNFDNDNARNIIVFGVGNSSSSHIDNAKNSFLEGPTEVINGSVGPAEKIFRINFSETNSKFS